MIVTVGHEKGGCGKTTTATNLAVWLARSGADVLLVDADRQLSATHWAAVRADDPRVPAVRCVQATGNISSTLRDLDKRYEHVVVDCGGRDSLELRSALLVSSWLLAPVRPSQLDLWAVAHLDEIVAAAKALNPRLRACAVLALVPTNVKVKEGQGARELITAQRELALLDVIIHDRKAYRDAIVGGWSVLEMDDKKAAAEAAQLAGAIYGDVQVRTAAAV